MSILAIVNLGQMAAQGNAMMAADQAKNAAEAASSGAQEAAKGAGETSKSGINPDLDDAGDILENHGVMADNGSYNVGGQQLTFKGSNGDNVLVEFGEMKPDGTYGTFELTPSHLANCKSKEDILKVAAKLASSFVK